MLLPWGPTFLQEMWLAIWRYWRYRSLLRFRRVLQALALQTPPAGLGPESGAVISSTFPLTPTASPTWELVFRWPAQLCTKGPLLTQHPAANKTQPTIAFVSSGCSQASISLALPPALLVIPRSRDALPGPGSAEDLQKGWPPPGSQSARSHCRVLWYSLPGHGDSLVRYH